MKDNKTFTVSVDAEPVEIPRKDVTPKMILVAAGLDPDKRYLIEVIGNKNTSYIDLPNDAIKVHANQTFLTACRGPVTVS